MRSLAVSAGGQTARQVAGQAAWSLLAIWGAVSIVFVATRMIGDPSSLLLPVGASAAELAALRDALGLSHPLGQQYVDYIGRVLAGDFGSSFLEGRPAMTVVLERLPATLALSGAALAIGLTVGLVAGACAALSPRGARDRWIMVLSSLGQATPAFWLGAMLIMIFSVQLGWLPTGGRGGLSHILLPAVTLAVGVAASIARLLRASLLEVLREDYVRTARAKGLLRGTVFFRHVLPNALSPVLSLTGVLAGELLGGSVVVETVFAWPGVGRLLIQSITGRDFPVIQAATLLIAALYVGVNLIVDIAQIRLDPRVRNPRGAR